MQIASINTEVGVKVDAMARCFLQRDEAFLIAAVTRSGDPAALPLRRRGTDRRPGTAARRSADTAAARAPATLPPFRSGGAVPTVVPVPQRVNLLLPLRALRQPRRRSAPAAR